MVLPNVGQFRKKDASSNKLALVSCSWKVKAEMERTVKVLCTLCRLEMWASSAEAPAVRRLRRTLRVSRSADHRGGVVIKRVRRNTRAVWHSTRPSRGFEATGWASVWLFLLWCLSWSSCSSSFFPLFSFPLLAFLFATHHFACLLFSSSPSFPLPSGFFF